MRTSSTGRTGLTLVELVVVIVIVAVLASGQLMAETPAQGDRIGASAGDYFETLSEGGVGEQLLALLQDVED